MTIELEDMRDGLSEALDELIAERDEAVKKSEMDKVTTAEAEMDRIGVVLATVQFALNEEQAINMNAVAARLLESVQAQRAVGLSTAAKDIDGLIKKLNGSVAGGGKGEGQRQGAGGRIYWNGRDSGKAWKIPSRGRQADSGSKSQRAGSHDDPSVYCNRK